MADKIVNTNTLEMVATFADDDYRTISIPDPPATLTSAQVKEFGNAAKDILIGDKTGAACTGLKSAKTVAKTTVYLDLTTA